VGGDAPEGEVHGLGGGLLLVPIPNHHVGALAPEASHDPLIAGFMA